MLVKELIEKLRQYPEDMEVAMNCWEETSEVKGVQLIKRAPPYHTSWQVLRKLGVKNPHKCKNKALIQKAEKISAEELAVRDKWYEEHEEVAEPYSQSDGFFAICDAFGKCQVNEAVMILGND